MALVMGLAAASFSRGADANPDGRIVGRSRTGCGTATTCHLRATGATAEIAGPMRVPPGARSSYTLTINSTLPTFRQGGCDISVSSGSLAVNAMQTGTRVNGLDLVHNLGLARAAGGPLTIRFDVVAPTTPGSYTIYAAGNATNGSMSSGDAWALATLAVSVGTGDAGTPTDAPASDVPASDVPASDVPPVDAARPDDASAPDDVAEKEDAVPWTADTLLPFDPARSEAYGRCNATPLRASNSGAWSIVLLVGVAALLRGRRR
jgi:hypothetical protein